jgi:hypothetical protein
MRLMNIFLVIAIVLLVSGVEQCPASSSGGGGFGGGLGGGTGSQASKNGVDVSVVPGVGFFSSGSQIGQDETFRVVLNIENYDKTEKKGTICVKDNQDDAYGGILVSGDCTQFSLPAADYNGNVLVKQASQKVAFPLDGEYSYHDIPIDSTGKIFVVLSYVQHSVTQGLINVPEPAQETVSLEQSPSPISVSLEKTVAKQQSQYKSSFGITLGIKTDANTKFYTEDMQNENSIKVSLKLSPSASSPGYNMDCTQGLTSQSGVINLESTKFIKCSSLLPLATTSYPILVYLDYGVKSTKSFDFKIKAEEEIK